MAITYSVDTSFSLHKANGNDYIQSKKISAKLKHPGLSRFLNHLLTHEIVKLSQAEFTTLAGDFQIDSMALQDFLISQSGLFKINLSDDVFSDLVFFGHEDVSKQLTQAFSGNGNLSIHHYNEIKNINTANTILVYFAPSLNTKEIRRFYDSSENENNYLITAYLLSEYLIIDNIYSKKSGLPCHFCHSERLKLNGDLIPGGQKKSWLGYYREMMRENNNVLFEPKLPGIYSGYIAYTLFQFIRRLVDPFCPEWHYDQYTHFWHIHLDKMQITKEAGSFWPYCSCQSI